MVETACLRKSAFNNESFMLFRGFRESGQFLQLLRSVTGQCESVMTHLLENQEAERRGGVKIPVSPSKACSSPH